MLLFFKTVQLINLLMKQRQTHAGSLQINYEIFITYSLCIHVLFESFMINSLVRQWDPIGGVSMFYS